eukprot:Hpha_TRINITY_DN29966_c0_g1::TRINITY_DN29966_c0_g1_i1::g.131789::m.131789
MRSVVVASVLLLVLLCTALVLFKRTPHIGPTLVASSANQSSAIRQLESEVAGLRAQLREKDAVIEGLNAGVGKRSVALQGATSAAPSAVVVGGAGLTGNTRELYDLKELLRQFAGHGYNGSVHARHAGACGRCGAGCEAEIADRLEVAALGPLLYQGDCRWVLAGADLCDSSTFVCSEKVAEQNIHQIAEFGAKPYQWTQREVPAGGGFLEVVRTPSSVPLLDKLQERWPLRVGVSGNCMGCELFMFPEEGPGGAWSLSQAGVKRVREQIGVDVIPLVPMAMQVSRPKGLRPRRSRRHGTVPPELYTMSVYGQNNLTDVEREAVNQEFNGHTAAEAAGLGRTRWLLWRLSWQPSFHYPPPWCLSVVNEPVHVIYAASHRPLVELNLGHWSLEALFAIYKARVGRGERAALFPAGNWDVFWGFSRHAPALLKAVKELAGVKEGDKGFIFSPGTCLARARLTGQAHKPGPEATRDMVLFIRNRMGLPAQILPAQPSQRLRAVLLQRWPGGTRGFGKIDHLLRVTKEENWDLELPLSPDKPNATMSLRFTEVLEATGRAHLVAAIHGAELTMGGINMAPGAVLVEISLSRSLMRHWDYWFSRYAYSTGVHVMRWLLPPNATRYIDGTFQPRGHVLSARDGRAPTYGFDQWMQGQHPRPNDKGYFQRHPSHNFGDYREYSKRTNSETFLPEDGWRRLLQRTRQLLETQLQDVRPVAVSGLPDVVKHPAW